MLSWFGVHTVLSGTDYVPPRALPLASGAPSAQGDQDDEVEPRASSTHRPKPDPSSSRSPTSSPSPSSSSSDGGNGRASSPASRRPTTPSTTSKGDAGAPPASRGEAGSGSSGGEGGGGNGSGSGNVKSYSVDGGRVVFDMGTDSAQLVSATPNPGWRMQVWKHAQWLRVDFVNGSTRNSVICSWNNHPPLVERNNNAT